MPSRLCTLLVGWLMLNHSCPVSVLQEGQALRNSNLGVGIKTLIIQQYLYSLLGMWALSCSQAPLLTKVPSVLCCNP